MKLLASRSDQSRIVQRRLLMGYKACCGVWVPAFAGTAAAEFAVAA